MSLYQLGPKISDDAVTLSCISELVHGSAFDLVEEGITSTVGTESGIEIANLGREARRKSRGRSVNPSRGLCCWVVDREEGSGGRLRVWRIYIDVEIVACSQILLEQ